MEAFMKRTEPLQEGPASSDDQTTSMIVRWHSSTVSLYQEPGSSMYYPRSTDSKPYLPPCSLPPSVPDSRQRISSKRWLVLTRLFGIVPGEARTPIIQKSIYTMGREPSWIVSSSLPVLAPASTTSSHPTLSSTPALTPLPAVT